MRTQEGSEPFGKFSTLLLFSTAYKSVDLIRSAWKRFVLIVQPLQFHYSRHFFGICAGVRTLIRVLTTHCKQRHKWRRERDSNPRYGSPYSGFQDRRLKPLGHLSVFLSIATYGRPWRANQLDIPISRSPAQRSTGPLRKLRLARSATSPCDILTHYFAHPWQAPSSASNASRSAARMHVKCIPRIPRCTPIV